MVLKMFSLITAGFVRFITGRLQNSYLTSVRLLPLPLLRLYHTVLINDDDLEEKFVKGWGKGGQKVNKTSNCVELKHKPSGMIVKCHQSRSLTRNRMIARQTLERNLDFLYNGKESSIGLEIAEKRKRKSDRLRKRKAKEEATKVSENNFNKTDQ